jgi:hypothetical protein
VSAGLLGDRVGCISGVQTALFVSVAERDLRGVGLSLGFNFADGEVTGVQLVGGANFAHGVRGAQLAIGLNVADRLAGVQVGSGNLVELGRGAQIGLINKATFWDGLQLGIVNRAGEAHGVQLGLVNGSDQTTGLQLAALNISEETGGVAVGLVNVARAAGGLSVGLVNISARHRGESLALLNLVGDGVHHLAFYATEATWATLGLKLGARHLYTLALVGYSPGDRVAEEVRRFSTNSRRWGVGLGVGWRAPLSRRWLDAIEMESTATRIGASVFESDVSPIILSLRAGPVLRLVPNVEVLAAVSLNLALSRDGQDADFGGALQAVRRDGATTARLYPGLLIGVQL